MLLHVGWLSSLCINSTCELFRHSIQGQNALNSLKSIYLGNYDYYKVNAISTQAYRQIFLAVLGMLNLNAITDQIFLFGI